MSPNVYNIYMNKICNGKALKQMVVSCLANKTFCINDLNCNVDYQTIKRQINRLVKNNYIKQIARGVYFRPTTSNKLNGMTSTPDIDDVANVIAKKNG